MDDISVYISIETIEKRQYIIDFFKRIEILKQKNKYVNVYRIGMEEDQKFWSELYEDDKLPEEKCKRKYINIGEEYQADII